MTRIPAVSPEEAGPLIKALLPVGKAALRRGARAVRGGGQPPQAFAAEVIAESVAAKASTVLPVNIRDLAVYRVAWTIGCSWCVDFGTMLARFHGLDIDQLKEIGEYVTSPRYSEDERAVIAHADAMSTTPPEATDEQVADLERRFGHDGVV